MCVHLAALFLALASLLPAQAPPADPRADPYFARPELRALMSWVTFQDTFDAGSLVPDMAAGEYKFTPHGTPQFQPGVKGLALQAGGETGAAMYPHARNFPLESRGSLSVWLCPLGWTHDNGPNTEYVRTANATFYLERQGPMHNAEGVGTRLECLLYIIRGTSAGNQTLYADTAAWPQGQWRLIVLNWDWPVLEISVNGEDFSTATTTGGPKPEEIGDFLVGSRGGEVTLMDELMIYRRPLTRAEAKALYQAFAPGG
jgi:hypothetical protein